MIKLHRRGDFYECDGDDAVVVAKALGLTLTTREGVPMCGVPFHRALQSVCDLANAGYTVDLIVPTRWPDYRAPSDAPEACPNYELACDCEKCTARVQFIHEQRDAERSSCNEEIERRSQAQGE